MSASTFRTITADYIDGQRPNRNYITNSNFTDNVAGFVTYKDAAGNIPVDGTGGTPTLVTISRSTTNPLTGDASLEFFKNIGNAQGEGMSCDFTIDLADRASVLEISGVINMPTSPNSPGYQFGTGTYSSVIVYIYDITNAALIEPQGIKLDVPPFQAPANTFRATFQTASNSSSYRLIFHVTDTSATSGYLINFDRLYVGRQQQASGAAVTDAVVYTPTLSNNGTTSVNTAYWRRVGDSIFIQGRTVFTGAGPAANFRVRIPAGFAIDTAKIPTSNASGVGNFIVNISGTNANGLVYVGSTANELVFIPDGAGGPYNGNQLVAGSDLVYNFNVPVTGWSSNVSMSSETDTRVVAASLRRLTGQVIASTGVATKVLFDSAARDTAGGFEVTNNRYRVPVSGEYRISGSIFWNLATANTGPIDVILYRNGSAFLFQQAPKMGTAVLNHTSPYTFQSSFNAGDLLEIYVTQSVIANYVVGADNTAPGLTTMNIERLSGPAVVAATETVIANYTGNLAGSMAAGTTRLNYSTRIVDTHNAVTTGANWAFTAPISGNYAYSASFTYDANTIPGVIALTTQRNGVGQFKVTTSSIISTNTVEHTLECNGTITLRAGETLNATCFSSVGGNAFFGNEPYHQIHIWRIGN